jgi:hypothetical protein
MNVEPVLGYICYVADVSDEPDVLGNGSAQVV